MQAERAEYVFTSLSEMLKVAFKSAFTGKPWWIGIYNGLNHAEIINWQSNRVVPILLAKHATFNEGQIGIAYRK